MKQGGSKINRLVLLGSSVMPVAYSRIQVAVHGVEMVTFSSEPWFEPEPMRT